MEKVDVSVVGAGPAGLACAIHAARGGARVLLVEKDTRLGGTLHLSGGHLAAAGTPEQAARGIDDSVTAHREDVRRISRGTAREDIVDVVVEHAADTLAWLRGAGFVASPETPRIVYGHEPYLTPRTHYGVDEGLSILAALEADLAEVAAATDLTVWTGAAVVDLVVADGGVVGVVVDRGGRDTSVATTAVVLSTGGYGADPELFAELEGAPLVSAAARTSTGDGIHLGRLVGAGLQGEGTFMPTFGGLPHPVSPGRADWGTRQRLTCERAPWEIYVDRDGRRWVAEDEESIDEKERAFAHVPDLTFWTVFDEAALRAATGEQQLVIGLEPDAVRALVDTRPESMPQRASPTSPAARASIRPGWRPPWRRTTWGWGWGATTSAASTSRRPSPSRRSMRSATMRSRSSRSAASTSTRSAGCVTRRGR